MGFFATQSNATKSKANDRPSNEFLHKLGCKACPLNNAKDLRHPKMDATGADNPVVYIIGEAPGEVEDRRGEQFVGPSGEVIRPLIPGRYANKIRWNNVLNCRPPNNRDPDSIEIECCRKRIVLDIEATKPKAIIGAGNFALQWVLDQTGITKWRGRRIPIKVGSHECWFYPISHPAALLKKRKGRNYSIKPDEEIAFEFDLKRVFSEVFANLPKPFIHTKTEHSTNVICIDGSNKDDLAQVERFLTKQANKKYSGLDYETQNKRPYFSNAKILSIGVASDSEALAFAWQHPQAKWSKSQFVRLNEVFNDFLYYPTKKVVHSLSFEMEWTAFFFGKDKLRQTGWEDTLSQGFTLDERSGGGDPGGLSLELLCIQNFGFNLKELAPKFNKKNMQGEPLRDVLPYNARDARYHLYLFFAQQKRLEQEGLEAQYQMMLQRVPTVVLTQLKGLNVDFKLNKQLAKKYELEIYQLEQAIEAQKEIIEFRKLTGRLFKPGSSKDVIILLRDIIRTTIGRKENGSYSTDEDVLSKIDRPITKLIVDLRGARKMKSTYIDPLSLSTDNSAVYPDSKLHPNLNTTFVKTGRTSSDDPNVQNYPKRDSVQKEVRKQIIP